MIIIIIVIKMTLTTRLVQSFWPDRILLSLTTGCLQSFWKNTKAIIIMTITCVVRFRRVTRSPGKDKK